MRESGKPGTNQGRNQRSRNHSGRRRSPGHHRPHSPDAAAEPVSTEPVFDPGAELVFGFGEEVQGPAVEAFRALNISLASAQGAALAGFHEPTEIQREVVPAVAAGRDVIAGSETGSGKTAAFVLPILDRLDYREPKIQVLVLTPTRELCRQVAEDFRELGRGFPLRVAEIYGGMSYTGQRRDLARSPQVVAGAPGRVLDLLGSRTLDFSGIKILVLDEADRMLDMGFMPQIRNVLKYVPRERQSLMFSATIPEEISRFAAVSLVNPVNILVGTRSKPPDQVIQEAVKVNFGGKDLKLLEILDAESGTVLIFVATKFRASILHNFLTRNGHNACEIHANRNQSERKEALDGFTAGKYRIMVATDVAQRGLDIEGISLVINYDLPKNAEDYVHRVGRTGRASASGRALSFVDFHEYSTLRAIEKLTGHTFQDFQTARKKPALRRRTRDHF